MLFEGNVIDAVCEKLEEEGYYRQIAGVFFKESLTS